MINNYWINVLCGSLLLVGVWTTTAQTIITGDSLQDKALATALWTINHNTDSLLLKAGADYGGEWTRDISINSWNAVSLLRPEVAEYSLWSVTQDRQTIGHQYWDKIIWTIAAWNHYLATGHEQFLTEAYTCAKNTMRQLEDSCWDATYGLFTGPAVYQDGIAGYEEPIFDKRWDTITSFVLDYPNSHTIKCLSTNAVYYKAYLCLAEMAKLREPAAQKEYEQKAAQLKQHFREHFFDKKSLKLYYLIDHEGYKHKFQEALGLSFSIMFGLVTPAEARKIVEKTYSSVYGVPTVWPHFKRYSESQPGRHNVMIWPHVNMFYASACAQVGAWKNFAFEMRNLTELATQHDPKGEVNFHEIYNTTGEPDGGWQSGWHWPPLNHQTWCATGYLRNYLYWVAGMQLKLDGLYFQPAGIDVPRVVMKQIPYRNALLDITIEGNGKVLKKCIINGKKSKPFIPADAQGNYDIVLIMR